MYHPGRLLKLAIMSDTNPKSPAERSPSLEARLDALIASHVAEGKFSDFDVTLIVVNQLRKGAKTAETLMAMLRKLEYPEQGGQPGKIARILTEMVKGGYIECTKDHGSSMLQLTPDGRSLISG